MNTRFTSPRHEGALIWVTIPLSLFIQFSFYTLLFAVRNVTVAYKQFDDIILMKFNFLFKKTPE